jgi:hypothetical protein
VAVTVVSNLSESSNKEKLTTQNYREVYHAECELTCVKTHATVSFIYCLNS